MHDAALTRIKLHLPLLGPSHEVVDFLLQLGSVLLVLDDPSCLGIVGELADDGGHGVHGVVNVVDVDEEQCRAEAAALRE